MRYRVHLLVTTNAGTTCWLREFERDSDEDAKQEARRILDEASKGLGGWIHFELMPTMEEVVVVEKTIKVEENRTIHL